MIIHFIFYLFSGSKCKERWECLRAQFRKHLNKGKKNGQADNIIWKYGSQMAFLRTVPKAKKRKTAQHNDESGKLDYSEDNIPQQLCSTQLGDGKDDIGDVTLSPIEFRKRKRKMALNNGNGSTALMKYLAERKKEEEQPLDPMDTFFSLMATTVKKFNPSDQHLIKTKVFALVSEVEVKYIHNQNVQAHATSTHQPMPLPSVPAVLPHDSTASSTSSQHPGGFISYPTKFESWHKNLT